MNLKEKAYAASLKDRVFNKSMAALTAKKVELKKQGLGRLPNKSEHITHEEECQMFESGAFSSNTPRGLLSALYYNFGKLFGLRARDEARQLKLEDIQLKETNGNTYLEFQERCTKTRDGSNVHDVRCTTPKIFPSADGFDNRYSMQTLGIKLNLYIFTTFYGYK